jgi:class 3 adenylate cyclase/DNA-binding NarL/FixJ family response regulator
VTIRVVLGDDNVLVREGVRSLLSLNDDLEVVGVADDAPSLMQAVEDHLPDVVVTDIKMPPNFQLEGIECAHAIREQHPGTGVVVLSAHDDEAYALALLGKGKSGLAYLLKDRLGQGDELPHAIREVAAGGSAIDSGIAARLSDRQEAEAEDRALLDMMAEGLGYAEMAARLGTTQESVDRKVTLLFSRLAGEGDGRGANFVVDEFKRLHAAVVDRESSARTLRSFLPSQVAERLSAGAAALEALHEEVEATVLFSDIRGFSTLAEDLPARDLAEIATRHLSAMAEVVVAHGGTIDKFAGDSVMAVFGAPNPMADHAQRALACGLAMQAKQAELNGEGAGEGRQLLEMGVGVNTGIVVAGTVGGGGRLEYTVVGDAVNVAQRLQAAAAGGQVLASSATLSAADGVAAEPLGPLTVKGRRAPVEAYVVIARSAIP